MFLWFNLDCAFFLTNSIEIKLISITIKQTNGGEGGELWVYGTADFDRCEQKEMCLNVHFIISKY